MNAEKINVIVYGLGPIGSKILQTCLQTPNMQVRGAVDIDPHKIGQDAGALVGLPPIGVKVVGSVEEIDLADLPGRKIALHATGSNLEQVWPQLKQLLDNGYSVVSTCEQLSYPWHRYPQLSTEIDQYARDKEQLVIGTGINPGFVMDALTLFATSVTHTITGIFVSRTVDVSKRRIPLQKKVGIGLTPAAFNELAQQNRIGHVGLEESLRLIAYGLHLTLSEVHNSIEPTLASKPAELAIGPLQTGEVSGLHQVARGQTSAGYPIVLDLVMSVDVKQEDKIVIETAEMGNLELVIPGGIFGDVATANIVANTAKVIHSSPHSGLFTMADIPLVRNIS